MKECCYRMRGSVNNLGSLERFLPSAGTLLQCNPFFERPCYTKEDFIGRESCCIKTKQCSLFYEVRPIPMCYRRSPFNPGIYTLFYTILNLIWNHHFVFIQLWLKIYTKYVLVYISQTCYEGFELINIYILELCNVSYEFCCV